MTTGERHRFEILQYAYSAYFDFVVETFKGSELLLDALSSF